MRASFGRDKAPSDGTKTGHPHQDKASQRIRIAHSPRPANSAAAAPRPASRATVSATPARLRDAFSGQGTKLVAMAIADNRGSMKKKLRMPVWAIGGETPFGSTMATVMRNAATNVQEAVVPGTGHWLMEERPEQNVALVETFLDRR
jgi:pimeloyl-ACP methyl ester carboxylesterase